MVSYSLHYEEDVTIEFRVNSRLIIEGATEIDTTLFFNISKDFINWRMYFFVDVVFKIIINQIISYSF